MLLLSGAIMYVEHLLVNIISIVIAIGHLEGVGLLQVQATRLLLTGVLEVDLILEHLIVMCL